MIYNWEKITNKDIAGLIRNGGLVAGYDAEFNRELVEESARRIERAAQLEAERDAVLERERIELIEWAARSNEQFALRQQTQLELDTARAAIGRYQDERVALLGRIETLIAENNTTNDAQYEADRLNRFLQVIVNIGDKDHHAAFDGERWREMRHCANQALMTKNEEYEP